MLISIAPATDMVQKQDSSEACICASDMYCYHSLNRRVTLLIFRALHAISLALISLYFIYQTPPFIMRIVANMYLKTFESERNIGLFPLLMFTPVAPCPDWMPALFQAVAHIAFLMMLPYTVPKQFLTMDE
jgi:hypothetical protein